MDTKEFIKAFDSVLHELSNVKNSVQTGMKIVRDDQKGIMTREFSGEIRRFARMKYSGKNGFYVSDSIIKLSDFVSFPIKTQAITHAKSLGYTAGHVERIGSRFWRAWGIKDDARENYFLFSVEVE